LQDFEFDQNNLKTSINTLLEEIEIYSKSFFDDYCNNSIRRSTQIVSGRTIYGTHFYDKLPIPKLSEIDRKNVSDKLFRAFLNEWNKIREILEKGRVEGYLLIFKINVYRADRSC